MITLRNTTRPVAVLAAAVSFSAMLAMSPLTRPASATTTVSLSTFSSRLLAKMNHARAARGIRKLVLVAGTTDVAHGWSCHMAGVDALSHNGNLAYQLETHGSSNWTTYGENVGVVPSSSGAKALFRAYMNSPGHRANILDPDFKYVGVWTKRSGAFKWNTVDFVGRSSSSYDSSYGGTRKTC